MYTYQKRIELIAVLSSVRQMAVHLLQGSFLCEYD